GRRIGVVVRDRDRVTRSLDDALAQAADGRLADLVDVHQAEVDRAEDVGEPAEEFHELGREDAAAADHADPQRAHAVTFPGSTTSTPRPAAPAAASARSRYPPAPTPASSAAPSALASRTRGTVIGIPRTDALIRFHAALRLPPPTTTT